MTVHFGEDVKPKCYTSRGEDTATVARNQLFVKGLFPGAGTGT